jgi:hypothetical protein
MTQGIFMHVYASASTWRILWSSALLSIAVLLSPNQAGAAASGTVSFQSKSWKVADAVAATSVLGYELTFSPIAWDRVAWAEDGKFDSFMDVGKFLGDAQQVVLKLDLNDDKSYRKHAMTQAFGPSTGKSDAGAKGLTVQRMTDTQIMGRFVYADADYKIDVQFDLPILARDAPLQLPGKALAADGGEPGKALLATFAALSSGDLQQMLAVSPPEKRAQLQEAAKNPKFATQLALMRTMQPTAVKISGGKVFEDRAWVEFTGKRSGKSVRGTASLTRVDGKWLMTKLSTRE